MLASRFRIPRGTAHSCSARTGPPSLRHIPPIAVPSSTHNTSSPGLDACQTMIVGGLPIGRGLTLLGGRQAKYLVAEPGPR
jgi:hypothetical protein